MSNQHSVIEHRANYFFLKIEEDYIAIFPEEDKHRHCKAAILSILEHWMNSKRTEKEPYPDMYVYLSYPQFAKQMFGLFSRSTIIKCLRDLVIDGLVFSHPYVDSFNQKTFAYMLNIPVINEKLRALSEKQGSVKMNGGDVNLNDPHVNLDDGSSINRLPSSKSKRNIDYIDSNIDTPQTDREEDVATSAEDRNAPAENVTHIEQWKEESGKHKAVSIPSHSQGLSEETEQQTTPIPAPSTTPAQRSGSPTGTLESHGAAQDKPPLALTARQIKAQAERREKELWAIIETERHTKYTEAQRKLYENKEGMKCLIADDISDEMIRAGLAALDAFQRKSFTVLKFYGWMPNLSAKEPTPITTSKAPPPNGVDHERNKRRSEELKRRFEEEGPKLKGLYLRHA